MDWWEEPYCTCVDWEPCLCGQGEPHCLHCAYRLPADALAIWLEVHYGGFIVGS